MRTLSLLLLLAAAAVGAVAQTATPVRGVVTDSVSGEALPGATVRVLGTPHGTITNARGEFLLRPEGPCTIVVSYLSYRPETLAVAPGTDSVLALRLRPSPVVIPEVVVLAEDPALEIIRQAIAHKRTWMDRLRSYRFEAFTRQVLRRDTAIASISEAYTTGYMRSGDTLREVVRQKRQTRNMDADDNAAAVRRMVNFNEDRVTLFSIRVNRNPAAYAFVGPTAPDALDHYDYRLLSTADMNGVEVYTIAVTPKSRLRPLFSGTIMIADGTFAVMGVDLRPNETLAIPFLRDIDLRCRQQFTLYDSLFWMPSGITIDGGFSVSIAGFTLPRIGIEQTSLIYDYAINVPVPDSIVAKRPVTTDSSAVVYDPEFWRERSVLPLTPEEERAYGSLDSTQTLDKQFEPKGPLASLSGDGLDVIDYLSFRFDRVEGFFLGLRGRTTTLGGALELYGDAGTGFSDNLGKFTAGATIRPWGPRRLALGAEVYRTLGRFPDGDYVGELVNSFTALLDKNDYDDYFYAHGFRLYLTASSGRTLAATASYVSEQHYTAFATTRYGLFNSSDAYRYQPPAADGAFRAVRLDLRAGPESQALGIATRDAVELSVERSAPWLAGSEFDYARVEASAEGALTTFGEGLLFPPQLRARIAAGTSGGTLPPQRSFTLDARSSGYAPFGVLRGSRVREFSGDAYAIVSVEHNFRTLPFYLVNLPFLYRNNVELLVHASAAQAWTGGASVTNGWYAEAGVGLGRVFDLLRFDLTWRFRDPARFYLSAGISTLL